jgi:polysaccharide biosynthesis/export protein
VNGIAKAEHFGLILLTACFLATGQPIPASPAPAQREEQSQYVLGPDDQVRVWVLGVEEISDKPLRIDPAGAIDLPLIGEVHAGGLTLEQLRAELTKRFSKEVQKPQVSVEIVDFGSQPVSVMGAVNHPGVHQLRGRKTLMEVISMADGLRQDAGPRITISREIQNGPVPLRTAKTDASGQFSVAEVPVKEMLAGTNPTENILILPHDVVTVPVAEAVYVIGEVRKPGEVALKGNATISVLQALSSAEGFGPTPAPQHAKVVRFVPGDTQLKEIPVDLKKVMAGKAEDIAMRPNDILVVPSNGAKKVAARAVEATIQTAIGIAIWRHP